jgi:AraC-like DNA-binding protein
VLQRIVKLQAKSRNHKVATRLGGGNLLFNSLSLCAGVLGIFLALPLLSFGRQRQANYWLGLYVLSISLLAVANSMPPGLHLRTFGLFDWPAYCLGPSYLLYVRSLLAGRLKRAESWHLVPALCFAAAIAMLRLLLPAGEAEKSIGYIIEHKWVVLIAVPQTTLYLFTSLYIVSRYRRSLRNEYSSLVGYDVDWLLRLTLCSIAVVVLWILRYLVGGSWIYGMFVGRIVLLYFIGWNGLKYSKVLVPHLLMPGSENNVNFAVEQTKTIGAATMPACTTEVQAPKVTEEPAPSIQHGSKYTRSGMTEATKLTIGERLDRRMLTSRDYLEGDITLSELAGRIGTSPQLLSQYINEVLKSNFFDYINTLRVGEVMRCIERGADDSTTLIELAYSCGFNSKSTFNSSFKRVTGTTPSRWRDTVVVNISTADNRQPTME